MDFDIVKWVSSCGALMIVSYIFDMSIKDVVSLMLVVLIVNISNAILNFDSDSEEYCNDDSDSDRDSDSDNEGNSDNDSEVNEEDEEGKGREEEWKEGEEDKDIDENDDNYVYTVYIADENGKSPMEGSTYRNIRSAHYYASLKLWEILEGKSSSNDLHNDLHNDLQNEEFPEAQNALDMYLNKMTNTLKSLIEFYYGSNFESTKLYKYLCDAVPSKEYIKLNRILFSLGSIETIIDFYKDDILGIAKYNDDGSIDIETTSTHKIIILERFVNKCDYSDLFYDGLIDKYKQQTADDEFDFIIDH